jgi:hypothetical protein
MALAGLKSKCVRGATTEVSRNSVWVLEINCARDRNALKYGFRPEQYFSLSKYVARNGAIMAAVLTVTFFALTAAMAAVRWWWQWWR